jgi:hypothetical protein
MLREQQRRAARLSERSHDALYEWGDRPLQWFVYLFGRLSNPSGCPAILLIQGPDKFIMADALFL